MDRPAKVAPLSGAEPGPRSVHLEPVEGAAGAAPPGAGVLAQPAVSNGRRGLAHAMGPAPIAPHRERADAPSFEMARAGRRAESSAERANAAAVLRSAAAASRRVGAASRSVAAASRTVRTARETAAPRSAPLAGGEDLASGRGPNGVVASGAAAALVVAGSAVAIVVVANGEVVNRGVAHAVVRACAGPGPRPGGSPAPAAPSAQPGQGCRCACNRGAVPACSPQPPRRPPRHLRRRPRAMRRPLQRT